MAVIEQSNLTLERLLNNDDSFDFFNEVIDNKNDYLSLEEDYRDLHEFFSNQLHTWQQLQLALAKFEKNKQALEKNNTARLGLNELQSIESADTPYRQLHRVAVLVSSIETINDSILSDKRDHALERIDEKIKQLEGELEKSGIATPELSNTMLRPLQLLKQDLSAETSIAAIYMLQAQTAPERLDASLLILEQALHHKQQEQIEASKTTDPDSPAEQTVTQVAEPKLIVEVNVASIFSKVSQSVYIESIEDVEQFIKVLEDELQSEIDQGRRIRLR